MEKSLEIRTGESRKKEPYTEPLLVKHEPLRELTGKSPEKDPHGEKTSDKPMDL